MLRMDSKSDVVIRGISGRGSGVEARPVDEDPRRRADDGPLGALQTPRGWSGEWIYGTLGLFNDYRVGRGLLPKVVPAPHVS